MSEVNLLNSQPVSSESYSSARRRAFIQDTLAVLSGRSDDLLSFNEVQRQLRLSEPLREISHQEIPLKAVVGSVGRYRDFSRAFLPRGQVDRERWIRIDRLADRGRLPPIDVFKVGEVFFVRDGNHRVSVARARGQRTIPARIVEIPVRIPLGSGTSPDELILKSGYAQFLERTSLDRSYPGQNIELTRAGGYQNLLQQIEIHEYYMGLRSRHYPTPEEAAADWYLCVYQPVVEQIRSSRILGRFPGRTEADLYLWITNNRARLQMRYGDESAKQKAVDDFAWEQRVAAPRQWMRRFLHWVSPRLRTREPRPRAPSAPPQDAAPSDP